MSSRDKIGDFQRAVCVPKDEATSLRMRAHLRVDTKPEKRIRSELHRFGLRFRKHFAPVNGMRCKPDIVFTRLKIAIFVDGCFWHACPNHGTLPKSNAQWWCDKLIKNVERDRRIDAQLRLLGWNVLRVWEHETVGSACDLVLKTVDSSLHSIGRSRERKWDPVARR